MKGRKNSSLFVLELAWLPCLFRVKFALYSFLPLVLFPVLKLGCTCDIQQLNSGAVKTSFPMVIAPRIEGILVLDFADG